jgi:hypothetical protein
MEAKEYPRPLMGMRDDSSLIVLFYDDADDERWEDEDEKREVPVFS